MYEGGWCLHKLMWSYIAAENLETISSVRNESFLPRFLWYANWLCNPTHRSFYVNSDGYGEYQDPISLTHIRRVHGLSLEGKGCFRFAWFVLRKQSHPMSLRKLSLIFCYFSAFSRHLHLQLRIWLGCIGYTLTWMHIHCIMVGQIFNDDVHKQFRSPVWVHN